MSWAQESETTFLDMPRGSGSAAYSEAVARRGLTTDIDYVDQTDQNFLSDGEVVRRTEPRSLPIGGSGNGFGVFLVVAVIALLLFLFLKFGAGGTLLRADPKEGKPRRKRAEGWGLRAEDAPAGDILSQIRAMTDRREALILLLRHCLLQAAQETDTNFARADTERDALRRLPDRWTRFDLLKRLLQQTELVHYGGREIDDTAYEASLQDGARILTGGRAVG
ncbi:hypothetical protein [Aliiroseovarius sp. YM-037]|uniref:hypothetical protein n=1 Tax=Aliiroseovarius sp. YM-037 TaxID=3341728 RepID=UPI003A80BC09